MTGPDRGKAGSNLVLHVCYGESSESRTTVKMSLRYVKDFFKNVT